ncbi:MAG: hypothetical protein ACHQM4_03625 [Thermoanaerobaculia bacterium]
MPYTNFSFIPAPLSVLAFLGAGLLTAALLAAAAVAALAGRTVFARRLLVGSAALPASYGAALVALGAATPERTVPRGGEKFFCGVDCHIGYSVMAFADSAENPNRRVVVALRSRFDETTIAPRRGNGPLAPDSLAATLVDSRRRRFAADPAGSAALLAPLRPGEAYGADLVFHVPPDAEGLRLSLVASEGVSRLLLGHERAPFAGETLLALR